MSRKCWYVKPPGARIWNRACIILRGSPYLPPHSPFNSASILLLGSFLFWLLLFGRRRRYVNKWVDFSPHSSLELWLQFLEHENSINQDSHVCVEMFEVSFSIFAYYEFVMWNGTQRIQDCQQDWPYFSTWKVGRLYK